MSSQPFTKTLSILILAAGTTLAMGCTTTTDDDDANTEELLTSTEAEEIIPHLVPASSVEVFHIDFPDPWHKRKHHKRRLLTPEFFKLLHTSLEPGGLLELATDNFDDLIAFRAALVTA